MRNLIYLQICIISVYLFFTGLLFGEQPKSETQLSKEVIEVLFFEPDFKNKSTSPSYKNVGNGWYDIDSVWGQGLPTDQKLAIFDDLWNTIETDFACFQGLDENLWDSIYNTYRPEIENDVSAGRFEAILRNSLCGLKETHTNIADYEFLYNTRIKLGIPFFITSARGPSRHFGAGLTPLPDSNLLVYVVDPAHPMNLEPGDIILGYDGQRWKDLYPQLLAMELPGNGHWGSCESAYHHDLLMVCGNNWHLFDTMDIIKYSTGDTVHISTSVMENSDLYVWSDEQLPIPGIEKPNYDADIYVTWGIIDGTDIGYIYSISWTGNAEGYFTTAISSLMNDYSITGLILDFRTNFGGSMSDVYPALKMMFNDTVETIGFASRNGPDHDDMILATDPFLYRINGNPESYFDKPIAVLIGPGGVSAGDQNPHLFSYHPMSKFFGKPVAGAFNSPEVYDLTDDFRLIYAQADAFRVDSPEHYLTHDEFPTDPVFGDIPYEHVWLTQEGVVNGRDDVVEAAKDWINSYDSDYDGFINTMDNCPVASNPEQEDFDGDGVGDSCDNCIEYANSDQSDIDADGIGDTCEYFCGDANNDKIINILDITYLIQYLYKDGAPPESIWGADPNGSGTVNIIDVTFLIAYLYKGGEPPTCRPE